MVVLRGRLFVDLHFRYNFTTLHSLLVGILECTHSSKDIISMTGSKDAVRNGGKGVPSVIQSGKKTPLDDTLTLEMNNKMKHSPDDKID
jgi:hypothetical protein